MVFIDIAPSISDVDVGESRRTITQNWEFQLFSVVSVRYNILYYDMATFKDISNHHNTLRLKS